MIRLSQMQQKDNSILVIGARGVAVTFMTLRNDLKSRDLIETDIGIECVVSMVDRSNAGYYIINAYPKNPSQSFFCLDYDAYKIKPHK